MHPQKTYFGGAFQSFKISFLSTNYFLFFSTTFSWQHLTIKSVMVRFRIFAFSLIILTSSSVARKVIVCCFLFMFITSFSRFYMGVLICNKTTYKLQYHTVIQHLNCIISQFHSAYHTLKTLVFHNIQYSLCDLVKFKIKVALFH